MTGPLRETITSTHNPLVREVLTLAAKPRKRRETGRFIIEGEREILAAQAAAVSLENLLYCPDLLPGNQRITSETALHAAFPKVTPTPVSTSVYARLAYRQDAQGLLALARIPQRNLDDLPLGHVPLLLIVQAVEKPGNLGALLRTADAAGANALVVCDPDLDLYNPNVVRASLGALFTVPNCTATTAEVIPWLQRHAIPAVVTTPNATTPHWSYDYTQPVAIVLGSEKAGVSQQWLHTHAGASVRIPMAGHVDSLNLAASGAILLFEALRQRSRKPA